MRASVWASVRVPACGSRWVWAPGRGRAGWALRAPAGLCLGPQEAPRPPGCGERAAAGPEARQPPGRDRVSLSSELDGGRSAERGRAWRGPGREGAETSAPLTPSPPHPQAPHARTHARPLGAPGARPGGCWLGGGGVRGRGGVGRPESGRGWCGSSTARAPVERCGWPARPAGQSEREAQRRALRAPGGSRLRLRPYHPERARSRLISEAKQGRAWLVLGWETAWEYRVL